MNIHDSLQKIKASRDIYAILTVIFTSLAAFYLGKLSEIQSARSSVSIERGEAPTASSEPLNSILEAPKSQFSISAPSQTKDLYVASKSGKKYHLTTCPGAKMISEANKIWFSSREEAEKAGYGPAGNCKGL